MKLRKKLVFDPATLSYTTKVESSRTAVLRQVGLALGSIVLALFYFWIYSSVLGLDSPKTALIRRQHAESYSRLMVTAAKVDQYEKQLSAMAFRDDGVYRAILGLNEISPSVREAGFGGVERYQYLQTRFPNEVLPLMMKVDKLTKMAAIESSSLDYVAKDAAQVDVMLAHVPAIAPMNPIPGRYRLSSAFGYRHDPLNRSTRFHHGIDFAMPKGCPLYATGDGVVESVKVDLFGYGRQVVINHGFGYKTRYAHCNKILVAPGQKVVRGQQVAESGNTGRSSGAHLHYEVIYKGKTINPYNFVDLEMSPSEYAILVNKVKESLGK